MSKIACINCRHKIDEAARVCPYCGCDPTTGQKLIDTDALLQEVFKPRQLSKSESVMEYARQRQGIVIVASIIVAFLLLAGLHQFVTMRNESDVSAAPAVPLTEVTDLSGQPDDTRPQPLPNLDFQYDGRPQVMRSYIVEPGAVTPPEIVAQQQAAAQAAAAKQQAAPPPAAPPQPQPVKPPAR